MSNARPFGWFDILRLGLAQTGLGAIVVLCTSTMNRVMVVEFALPAMLPGALVGIHYALQMLRPRWGYGSDIGGRRTPWIIGGMALLAGGGFLASVATAWMADAVGAGIALALFAFLLVGIGAGASGTSLLVLLATRVEPGRRGPAATIIWVMMISGFIATAFTAGHFLDPFTPQRLVAVTGSVSASAFLLTLIATWGIEGAGSGAAAPAAAPGFRRAFADVWAEPHSRRFAVFILVSMLAYSAQDLILEPFAGAVFGMTPGESTRLSGLQHTGVLAGMIVVALATSRLGGGRLGTLHGWTVGGCFASAAALVSLSLGALAAPEWPLKACVFALGVANGAFAVAAIGSMMNLAGSGRASREGTRMGLWGAAQAISFGVGGFAGTAASDLAHALLASSELAYAAVFLGEGMLFVAAALLALNMRREHAARPRTGSSPRRAFPEPLGR